MKCTDHARQKGENLIRNVLTRYPTKNNKGRPRQWVKSDIQIPTIQKHCMTSWIILDGCVWWKFTKDLYSQYIIGKKMLNNELKKVLIYFK